MPARYDILRLITRLNVGGPARQALLLTRGLNEEFPTLLAAGRPSAAEGELTDPTVAVHHVPLVRSMRPRTDLAAVSAVRRLIADNQVRLVHSHMAKAGAVGRIAARSVGTRPRTVHTFHGHVLEGYFSPHVEKAFLQTERLLAKTTDVLIAISPEIRDSLLDLGVGRASQYRVIPLGLDLESFLEVEGPSGDLRASLGLAPTVPLVGVAGRLVPIKDLSTLLGALEHLPGVHLAIIGDGELRGSLEMEVQLAKGLSGRVHFTGWRHDMAATFADVDVVALSSRNEGTPVALIEALAAGRAVAATDVGGVRSVVIDEATGLLAPAGDVDRMATIIRRLLESPDLRQRLGAAGREHVAQEFGAGRLVADVRELYSELLGAAGPGSESGTSAGPASDREQVVCDREGNSFSLRPIACPTCKVPATKTLGLRGGQHHRYGFGIESTIKRCRTCGILFPDPFPYPLDAQRLYGDPDKYFERHDSGARVASYQVELRELIAMSPAGRTSSLLDVGSGRGELLQAAKLEGLTDIVGLELSKAMIEYVRDKHDITVLPETIEKHATVAGRTYDIFVLSAILEHLYDPDAAIRSIAALAHPDSVLWVDVPNEPNLVTIVGNGLNKVRRRRAVYNLSPTFSPYHVFGFNRASLGTLLTKHGFVVEKHMVAGWSEIPAAGGAKDKLRSAAATQLNRVGKRLGMGPNLTVWARYTTPSRR